MISLSFHSQTYHSANISKCSSLVNDNQSEQRGIYLLQTIEVNNTNYTIFYDNGCSDFIVKHSALRTLGPNASKESSGSITLGGVGNTSMSSLGTYNVKLPLHNGEVATLTGACLPKITTTFPVYPLSQVEQDINHQTFNHYQNSQV